MKLYLGIVLVIIGALLVIASYFIPGAVDNNWFTGGSLLLIIVGFVAHILINKKAVE